jgi:hypothetical protein
MSRETLFSIKESETSLVACSLSQGFDTLRTHSGTYPTPSSMFKCVFHGEKTRGWRQLEIMVERNEEGEISPTSQPSLISVRQTGWKRGCKLSCKSIGKRGKSPRGLYSLVDLAASRHI